jgi:hypothetical protein
MQLLTAPELHQLLLITAAWLAGLLHQQKQGRAAVHTASVIHSLSNSSAAAAYSSDNSSSSSSGGGGTSSSSSSSSTIQVEPHHIKVLELLGAPALDPRKHSDPGSCKEATAFCSTMLQSLDTLLPASLDAAGFCLDTSVQNKSNEPASSSCRFGSWCELVPALLRMLVAIGQLGPSPDVRHAVLLVLLAEVRLEMSVWQQPAGAAAVGEMVMQLGPAVLHAHQQQQQSQEDAVNCQFELWYWAVAVMKTVGTGGCCKGVTLQTAAKTNNTCRRQQVRSAAAERVALHC